MVLSTRSAALRAGLLPRQKWREWVVIDYTLTIKRLDSWLATRNDKKLETSFVESIIDHFISEFVLLPTNVDKGYWLEETERLNLLI